jgi:transcription elongation factor GreA
MLRNARIIDDEDISTDSVSIGSTVRILDIEYDEVMEYTIVGSAEADPGQNRISNESPVGRALIGQQINSVVDVHVPDGVIKLKILEIKK